MALLDHFLDETNAEDLARELARQAKHDVLNKVDEAVGKGLMALTAGVRFHPAALGFATEESLVDIVRHLRVKLVAVMRPHRGRTETLTRRIALNKMALPI